MNDFISTRNITEEDNEQLAKIIRASLLEFKANKPGTVYFDDTTDHLAEIFKTTGSIYFVALIDNEVVGGAGIFPTKDLPAGTCELVKLYLTPKARGKGIGKLLVQLCIKQAIALGYRDIYLESMPELKIAIPMYEKFGFKFINGPLGNSGHTGCDVWMTKNL